MTATPTLRTHQIEHSVVVYLVLGPDGKSWELDPLTLDGEMDGTERTPTNSSCTCTDKGACGRARGNAAMLAHPTALEVASMILAAAAAEVA